MRFAPFALLTFLASLTTAASAAPAKHVKARHAARAPRAALEVPLDDAKSNDDDAQPQRHQATGKFASAERARGLYVRGETASKKEYDTLLDRAVHAGLDTIVLDAKDYDGLLTYASHVPLAIASGATKHAPLADLATPIKKARAKGLRVAVRISCFEDELLAKARPRMSVQSKAGRAYPIGWLDPSNPDVQSYVMDLAKEAIASGADEIELDYVRYPVLGIKNADFKLEERGLTKTGVITDFVHKVHAITRSRGIPLSLDVFGVIAFGKRADIDQLGQDPPRLAAECEVLSPMVYPSHYSAGFYGLDAPGDHPELVGMAIKAMKGQIDAANLERPAVLRPWLQAMAWKSPAFSSGYIRQEIHSSDDAGGSGFLLWNPGQSYNVSFGAMAAERTPTRTARASSTAHSRSR